MDRRVFAKRLKDSRENRKLSLNRAASTINVDPIVWRSWEVGDWTEEPGTREFMAAATLLDVDPEWLAGMPPR